MNRKALENRFKKIVLAYLVVFFAISVVRFLVVQMVFPHFTNNSLESIPSNLIRSFDFMPIIILYIPFMRKKYYKGVLRSIAQSMNMNLVELINHYHLNAKYFKSKKGTLSIKVTKLNAILRDLDECMQKEDSKLSNP